jgi:hypothetical protein
MAIPLQDPSLTHNQPPDTDICKEFLGLARKASPDVKAAVSEAIEKALVETNPSFCSDYHFYRTFTELGLAPAAARLFKKTVCSSLGISLPENSVVDGRAITPFPFEERVWLSSQNDLGFPSRGSYLDDVNTPRELLLFLMGADLASLSNHGMRVSEDLIQRASCYTSKQLKETLLKAIVRRAVEEDPADVDPEQFSSARSVSALLAAVQNYLNSIDSIDAVALHVALSDEFGFAKDVLKNPLGEHGATGEGRWNGLMKNLEEALREANRFIG